MDQISKMGQIPKAEVLTKRFKSRNFLNSTSEAQKWPRKLWLQSIILTCFDRYLGVVRSRGDLLLFLDGKWLHKMRITSMERQMQLFALIRLKLMNLFRCCQIRRLSNHLSTISIFFCYKMCFLDNQNSLINNGAYIFNLLQAFL